MWIDARIPVRFGPLQTRAAHEAVLTDTGPSGPGTWAYVSDAQPAHQVDCACCIPRTAAAVALAALFRTRATGSGTPFRSVLAAVGPHAEAAIRTALEADPVTLARFRLAPPDQAGTSASPCPNGRCI